MTNPATKAQVAAEVEHPAWCDLTQYTATPAVARGEAHRGTPATVTVRAIYDTLKITAVLSQAHCRWETDAYVDFDVLGERHGHQAVGGMAAFTVAKLAAIGQLDIDLAEGSSNGGRGSEPAPRTQQGRYLTSAGLPLRWQGVVGDDRP